MAPKGKGQLVSRDREGRKEGQAGRQAKGAREKDDVDAVAAATDDYMILVWTVGGGTRTIGIWPCVRSAQPPWGILISIRRAHLLYN